MAKSRIIILLVFCAVMLTKVLPVFAKEKPLPAFRITGYIEKIEPETIKIFVPRMKQSMALLLAKNMKITNFADNEDKILYSIKDLKEKDLAVCEGVITSQGFICQSIAFVRAASSP